MTAISNGMNTLDYDKVVISAVKKVAPSVVSIVISKQLPKIKSIYPAPFMGPFMFGEVEGQTEKVKVGFYPLGNRADIELLEGTDPESPITKFIDKKGQGIHHIAFETDDIVAEMQRLKDLGFELLSDQPKKGADNKLICFLHPKSPNGVLVELCQEIK